MCLYGQVRPYDIGQRVMFSDYYYAEITAVHSNTEFTVSGVLRAQSNVSAAIGTGTILRVSIDEDVLTVTDGRDLTSDDENKLLFLDTTYVLIKKVNTISEAILAWSYSIDDAVAAVDPYIGAYFCDTTEDTVLQQRIEANATDTYILQTRFMQPLPDYTVWGVVNGWIFGANPDESVYYYGDLTRKQHAGYYLPTKQYCDKLSASITQIVGYPDHAIIRCRNSTHRVQTSIATSVGDATLGQMVQVLNDPIEVDGEIGVVGQFDSAPLPGGKEIVFCNDKAVRFFDGSSYSEAVDAGRVRIAKTKKYKHPVIIAPVRTRGVYIWGR